MKLYIDTTKRDSIYLRLNDIDYESDSRIEKSQVLLPFIIQILGENKLEVSDLTEIEVNTGPGSFTGIRVGVSIAQTIAWVYGIPLNGKNLKRGETLRIEYESLTK